MSLVKVYRPLVCPCTIIPDNERHVKKGQVGPCKYFLFFYLAWLWICEPGQNWSSKVKSFACFKHQTIIITSDK